MSDSDLHLPPMGGDVEEVLRAERERPRLNPSRTARMWTAISAELVAAPAAEGAEPAPVESPVAARPGRALGRPIFLKSMPWVVATLGVGMAGGFVTGMAVQANHRAKTAAPSEARSCELSASGFEVPLAAPAEESSSPGTVAAPPTSAAAVEPRAPHRAVAPRADDALAAEEAMLRQAEGQLRVGNWSAALGQTDAYARRFPNGQLAEESAYLGVRASLRSGDEGAARARLDEFRKRFPLSPLGRTLGD